MEVGNVIHEWIQPLMAESFFTRDVHTEEHIEDHDLLFRGTPDQWGYVEGVGWVLMEYKSIASYQSDKRKADKYIKLVQTDDEEVYQDIYTRLKTGWTEYSEPKAEHLTQFFTYVLVIKHHYGITIDKGCICYLRKDTLEPMEFWFDIREETEMLKRAMDNFSDRDWETHK